MSLLRIARASLFSAAVLLSPIALSDVIILTPDSDYARDIATKLKAQIYQPTTISQRLNVNSKTEVVITLGRDAFIEATQNTTLPIVGSFLSSTDNSSGHESTYKIYSDPSSEKIADFLKSFFPNAVIGYIYTDDSLVIGEINNALENSNTRLEAIQFSGNTFADIRVLTRKGIDAMLVDKNPGIYKPDNIRFVLESLFRKKVPVVSTSTSLIPAGATVSITPNLSAIIETTSSSVNALTKGAVTDLPSATYVDDVEIRVNSALSEYFNIHFGEMRND